MAGTTGGPCHKAVQWEGVASRTESVWLSALGPFGLQGKARIWGFFWEQVAWEASRTGGTGFLHIEGGRRELEQRLGVWWPACQQKPVCVRVGNAVAGRTG